MPFVRRHRPMSSRGSAPKVLVTGQSGFIGRRLTARLADRMRVVGLRSDLRDLEAVRQEVADVAPEVVIHLAARTEVETSFFEPVDFSAVNFVGTVNLIEAARQLDGLRLFLFASSMETYGWQPESDEVLATGTVRVHRPFDESTPQQPNAPYAVAKVACERYLEYAARAYGFPFVAVRQTNIYGRHDNAFFVVEQMVTQMLASERLAFGEPLPYRSFIFIDDVLDLYSTVLEDPEPALGGFLNTGPANALQIQDLAARLARRLGRKDAIHWHEKPKRVGEVFYLNTTGAKAERLYGWCPRVELDEGLERTIALWKGR
jgi:nucleoside-diphosphate-sugar epimerase